MSLGQGVRWLVEEFLDITPLPRRLGVNAGELGPPNRADSEKEFLSYSTHAVTPFYVDRNR